MQCGEHPNEGKKCVGCGATKHAGVHGLLQGLDFDGHGDDTAQISTDDWMTDNVVAGVSDYENVRGEHLWVRLDELLKVAVGLLLTLDDDSKGHRRIAVERLQRRGMHGDTRLVVGRPTSIEPTVAQLRRPWIGTPALLGRRRLDVVVGVQQDGRCPRGTGYLGVDDGYPSGTSTSRAFSAPLRCSSETVASAIASTGSAGNPGKAHDGIATSLVKSSTTPGIRSATTAAQVPRHVAPALVSTTRVLGS